MKYTYLEVWDALAENCLGSAVIPDTTDLDRWIARNFPDVEIGDTVERTASQEDIDDFLEAGGHLVIQESMA